jgi:uncharacterized repeat protein (TIGR02543 family)
VKGFLSHQDEIDLFRFNVPSAGNMTLTVLSETGYGVNNVRIRWFDGTGVEIHTVNNQSLSSTHTGTRALPAAGTYYIMISRVNATTTGTYFLKADFPGVASQASYTVTFNANGGSGAPSSQIKPHGQTLRLSTSRPTRSNHTFLGWATTSGATTVQYQPWDIFTENVSTTLFAVWQLTPTYTITYNANWGLGAPTAQTKIQGTPLTLSNTIPTRTGFHFLGWATTQTTPDLGVEEFYPGNSFTTDAVTTLFAVWQTTASTYTISYNANGGVGAPSAQTKTHGTNLRLSSIRPTRSGHTFMGWSRFSNATTAEYAPGIWYSIDANRTLYAMWKTSTETPPENCSTCGNNPCVCGVAYHPVTTIITSGGLFPADSQATIEAEQNRGYRFIGWYKPGATIPETTNRAHTFTVAPGENIFEARFVRDSG